MINAAIHNKDIRSPQYGEQQNSAPKIGLLVHGVSSRRPFPENYQGKGHRSLYHQNPSFTASQIQYHVYIDVKEY